MWLEITGAALLGWLVLYLAVRIVSRPRAARPAAAAQALGGDESPALVSLLVHRGSVSRSAVAATLVDLAARGYVDLADHDPRIVGLHDDGRPVMTVALPASSPTGRLLPHEELVLHRVRALAMPGPAPVAALASRDPAAKATWDQAFVSAVLVQSRAAGLSISRYGVALSS